MRKATIRYMDGSVDEVVYEDDVMTEGACVFVIVPDEKSLLVPLHNVKNIEVLFDESAP